MTISTVGNPGVPIDELLATRDEAVSVLDGVGETMWRGHLVQARAEITNGDFYGVERLLGAFGGMGSFNDLVLVQPGSPLPRAPLIAAQHRLDALRTSIWRTCLQLRRDLQA